MKTIFLAVFLRDLQLAKRRRIEALLPIVFFIVAMSLFPIGVGPEPQVLRQIAPGLIWVCAMFAAMLSLTPLYASDLSDGSLEQMLLTGESAIVVAAAKAASHWTLTGLPLVFATPLFGVMLDMHRDAQSVLVLTLMLGTPMLSLLGSVAAALTLGLRSAGVLNILLVLPLAVPVLIFGTDAVTTVESGQSPQAHFSILGALLIFTALTAPPASAAGLRIALE
ncbi:heme exporter protein CcmB [Cupriavidus necator]